MLINIAISLLTGLISGIVSGFILYKITKREEQRRQVFLFWQKYLFDSLQYCDMYLPIDMLSNLAPVGGANSKFGQAIIHIMDILHPENSEDKVMSDEENELFEQFEIAWKELMKWGNAQH